MTKRGNAKKEMNRLEKGFPVQHVWVRKQKVIYIPSAYLKMLHGTKLPSKGQKNKPHLYVCWLSGGRMQRKQLIWRKINIWKQCRLPGSLAAIFSIICWNVTWFLKCCFLPHKYAITTKWVWKGTNQMTHINSEKKGFRLFNSHQRPAAVSISC